MTTRDNTQVERISLDELRAMTPQELDQRLDGAIARYERVMRRVMSEAATPTPGNPEAQHVQTRGHAPRVQTTAQGEA